MSQAPKKPWRGSTAIQRGEAASPSQAEFDEVLALIDAAKARAVAAVNTTLIDLYWSSANTSATRSPLRPGGSGPSRPWPNTPAASSGQERVLGKQPLADAAVLRDLPRTAKTRTRC